MESESKYYTPDIESLHVGYECELSDFNFPTKPITKWKQEVLDERLLRKVVNNPMMGYIRTPFLTKEQVESEKYPSNVSVLISEKSHEIQVYNDRTKDKLVFYGYCPSINELRFISKLLGI